MKKGMRAAVAAVALGASALVGLTSASATLTGSPYNGLDGTLDTVAGITATPDKPSGSNDNSFGQGTKENNSSATIVGGSIPPNKNDLTNFYEGNAFQNGSEFIYLAWSRAVNLGNADLDFEINQHPTTGFTASKTGGIVLNRTPGDLLITYDFAGTNSPIGIGLATWTTSGWTTPLTLNGTPNAEASISADGLFGEVVVNLTGAGVFPADSCEAFGSAFVKSRSSTSFTSELKDFIAPAAVNISNCGTIKIVKNTINGDNTFSYTSSGFGGGSFSLATSGGTASQTFSKLNPGSGYSVTEGAQPSTAWFFVSLTCTASSGSSYTIDPTTPETASITLGGGGEVDCTYTNKTKLSPTISTTLSANPADVGSTVHDSATLSGGTSDAGGTVTYTVYSDSSCSMNAQDGGTVTVTNGSVPDSNPITFNTAGDYYWQAVYSGDGNNNGKTSTCTDEHLVVQPKQPTQSTAQSLIPDDSFTLAGGFSPTGSITFSLYAPTDSTCANTPAFTQTVTVNGNGKYSTTNASSVTPYVATTVGTYRWKDVYTSGDTNNKGVTSACGVESFTISNG